MDQSLTFSASIFVQLALACYVLGLLARRELVLRGLLMLGTVFYILYYYWIAETPLWDAILSSAVIGAANLVMIAIILHERSTVGMSPEMLELYRAFPTLNPGQFRKIMKRGTWVSAERDMQLCRTGVRLDKLYLVASGTMRLERGGDVVEIGHGNFIGEISFLLDGPATADVVATRGSEFVQWDRTALKAMMARSPRLSNAIGALFNTDIARKLSVSWPVGDSRSDVTRPGPGG